jgi:aminobenzoyl-glutamate utilization protein B
VEIMNVAVNFLREHVPSDVRIHYAIMDGGKAPNVVPSYARSWYYVRGKDRARVEEISARVHNCARAAALATDTRMKRTLLSACYDRLPNDALAGALQANLKLVGGPRFTDEDREIVRRLGLTGELRMEVEEITTARNAGSSDEANVSWITPLSVLGVACWADGTPGHHWLVHEQSVSSVGLRGLAVAVKVLSLTAVDLVCDRRLLNRAKREFRKRTGGKAYDPLIPANQAAPVQDQIP